MHKAKGVVKQKSRGKSTKGGFTKGDPCSWSRVNDEEAANKSVLRSDESQIIQILIAFVITSYTRNSEVLWDKEYEG